MRYAQVLIGIAEIEITIFRLSSAVKEKQKTIQKRSGWLPEKREL
jgi:hypothetical protein